MVHQSTTGIDFFLFFRVPCILTYIWYKGPTLGRVAVNSRCRLSVKLQALQIDTRRPLVFDSRCASNRKGQSRRAKCMEIGVAPRALLRSRAHDAAGPCMNGGWKIGIPVETVARGIGGTP